jgi:hypothetical protein
MQARFEWPVMVAALLVIPSMVLLRGASGSTALWAVEVLRAAAILWVAPHRSRWISEHPLVLRLLRALVVDSVGLVAMPRGVCY